MSSVIEASDLELFQLGRIADPPASAEWKVIAKHKDCDYYEEIDTAESSDEANYMVGEYALAFGPEWHIDLIEPTV